MNNLDIFLADFADYGDKIALISNNQKYSYNWLVEKIKYWSYILSEAGIEKSIVSFKGDYSPEIIALFFAVMNLQNILVPLGVNNKEEKNKYLEIANARYILAIDKQEK